MKSLQIGFVGLVEEEWIDTLSTIDPEDLEFQDFVQRGTELAKKLKSEVKYSCCSGIIIIYALLYACLRCTFSIRHTLIMYIFKAWFYDYFMQKKQDRNFSTGIKW